MWLAFPINKFLEVVRTPYDLSINFELFLQQFSKYNKQLFLTCFSSEWIFQAVSCILKLLRNGKQDKQTRFNLLLSIKMLFDSGVYTLITLVEVYLLDIVTEIAVSKSDQTHGYQEHLLARQFILMAGKVKKFRTVQNQELSQKSRYLLATEALSSKAIQSPAKFSFYNQNYPQIQRQKYMNGLQEFNQSFTDDYIEYFLLSFIDELEETSKQNQNQQKLQYQSLLAYSDAYLTSTVINLSEEELNSIGQSNIANRNSQKNSEYEQNVSNFSIKRKYLQLYDEFIRGGDIEAILLLTKSEFMPKIALNISNIKGDVSINQGQYIYPEIPGQHRQKLQFYIDFLSCVQKWGESFPQDEEGQQSNIFKIYKYLHQDKHFKFPQNLMLQRYVKQVQKNLLKNSERNQKLLQILGDEEEQYEHENLNGQSINNKISENKLSGLRMSRHKIENSNKLSEVLLQQLPPSRKQQQLWANAMNQNNSTLQYMRPADKQLAESNMTSGVKHGNHQNNSMNLLQHFSNIKSKSHESGLRINNQREVSLTNSENSSNQLYRKAGDKIKGVFNGSSSIKRQSQVSIQESNIEKQNNLQSNSKNAINLKKISSTIIQDMQKCSRVQFKIPASAGSMIVNSQPGCTYDKMQYIGQDEQNIKTTKVQMQPRSISKRMAHTAQYQCFKQASNPIDSNLNHKKHSIQMNSKVQPSQALKQTKQTKQTKQGRATIAEKKTQFQSSKFSSLSRTENKKINHKIEERKKKAGTKQQIKVNESMKQNDMKEASYTKNQGNYRKTWSISQKNSIHSTQKILNLPNKDKLSNRTQLILIPSEHSKQNKKLFSIDQYYGMGQQSPNYCYANHHDYYYHGENDSRIKEKQRNEELNTYSHSFHRKLSDNVEMLNYTSMDKRSSYHVGNNYQQNGLTDSRQIAVNNSLSSSLNKNGNFRNDEKFDYFSASNLSKYSKSNDSRSLSSRKKGIFVTQKSKFPSTKNNKQVSQGPNQNKKLHVSQYYPNSHQIQQQKQQFNEKMRMKNIEDYVSGQYFGYNTDTEQYNEFNKIQQLNKQISKYNVNYKQNEDDMIKSPSARPSNQSYYSTHKISKRQFHIDDNKFVQNNIQCSNANQTSDSSVGFVKAIYGNIHNEFIPYEPSLNRKGGGMFDLKSVFLQKNSYFPKSKSSDASKAINVSLMIKKDKQINELKSRIENLQKESRIIYEKTQQVRSESAEARNTQSKSKFWKLTVFESYNKYLKNIINIPGFKKLLLRSKCLLQKTGQVQIGLMCSKQPDNTIQIILYITPLQSEIKQVEISIRHDENVKIAPNNFKFNEVVRRKQQKVKIIMALVKMPFEVPQLQLTYRSALSVNRKQSKREEGNWNIKYHKYVLPVLFNKFCDFEVLDQIDKQSISTNSSPIVRLPEFSLNPKLTKIQKIHEILPNFTQFTGDKSTTQYSGKCSYKNNNFFINLYIINKKTGLLQGGILNNGDMKCLQLLLISLQKIMEFQMQK